MPLYISFFLTFRIILERALVGFKYQQFLLKEQFALGGWAWSESATGNTVRKEENSHGNTYLNIEDMWTEWPNFCFLLCNT